MASNRDGISAEQAEAILQCPICYEVPNAPILSCQTGHTVCGDCRKKVPNCPLCRQGFTNGRNFIAESLAASLSYRCPYSAFGCETCVKNSQKDEHMKLCNFRPIVCEVHPCVDQYIGYRAYLDHLTNIHRVTTAAGRMSSSGTHSKFVRETYVWKPERLMEQGHRVPYTMTCFGHTFIQYTQAVGGEMRFWVSLFGTPEEARRFRITLTLSSSSKDQELKNVWIGTANSLRSCGDDICSKGMVMTEECLKAYVVRHQSGFEYYSLEIEIEKLRNSAPPQAHGHGQRLIRRFTRAFKASSPLIGLIAFAVFCIVSIYHLFYALYNYIESNIHLQLTLTVAAAPLLVVVSIMAIMAHR